MPSILTTETRDSARPLMLVSGNIPYVTDRAIRLFAESLTLVVLNNHTNYKDAPNIIQVYETAVQTITKLDETISYALFFLANDNDKKLIQTLLPKLEKDKTRAVILIPVQQVSTMLDVVLATKHLSTIRIALLGELFGNAIPAEYSHVSAVIHSALFSKEVAFTGDDIISVFPISLDDALIGIQSLLYGKQKDKLFNLFYEHPQTFISTVHLLKNIEPDLQIAQEKSRALSYPPLLSHREIEKRLLEKTRLHPEYLDGVMNGFEASVKAIEPQPIKRSRKPSRRIQRIKAPVKKFKLQTPINLLLIGTMLFLVLNTLTTVTGVVLAKQTVQQFREGKYDQASRTISISEKLLTLSNPTTSLVFQIASVSRLPQIDEMHHQFQEGVKLTGLIAQEIKKSEKIKSGISELDLRELLATLSHLYFSSQSTENTNLKVIGEFTSPKASMLLSSAQVLPDLMGYKRKQHFLLLFQNNGELRPTGGFIGSIGELTTHHGKIEEFVISDVYALDGQLKKHYEPPFPVRRYLQPHLYLRDSNFALSFQEAATTSAQLYKEVTGKGVDGVIAIDFETLKQIIKIVGPLHLPNYKTTINEENSFEFIHETIEDSFFPGSTKKRDILSEVFQQLLLKLENPQHLLQVVKHIPQLMVEKHILVALYDPSLQETFSAQGFGGEFKDRRVESTGEIQDFLAINEANIGVNKANIKVTRSIRHAAKINEKDMTSTSTITLDNTKNSSEAYTTYLRFVVPSGSTLENLVVDDQKQKTIPAITNPEIYESDKFTTPKEVEIVEDEYHGKKVFGFVATVPAGQKRTIALTYRKAISLPKEEFTYSFLHLSQPGTIGYPLTLVVSYPEGYEPEAASGRKPSQALQVRQDKIITDYLTSVKLLKRN